MRSTGEIRLEIEREALIMWAVGYEAGGREVQRPHPRARDWRAVAKCCVDRMREDMDLSFEDHFMLGFCASWFSSCDPTTTTDHTDAAVAAVSELEIRRYGAKHGMEVDHVHG